MSATTPGRSPLPGRLLRRLLPGPLGAEVCDELEREYFAGARASRSRADVEARSGVLAWLRYASHLVRPGTWVLAFSLRRRAQRRRQGIAGRPGRPGRSFSFSWLDVKLGLRMIRRYPGITFVAVLSIGAGIPVGLYPTHLVEAFEGSLPVEEGDRVLVLRSYDIEEDDAVGSTLFDFERWRGSLTSFERLGASTVGARYNVATDDGRIEPVRTAQVTASTFQILRVRPWLGRALLPDDEGPGAPRVAVIGFELWRDRLGSDPEVVGRDVRIAGVPHTIVGVMPEGFLFPARDELWVPLRAKLTADEDRHGTAADYVVFGRLTDGASPASADTELRTVGQRMASELPDAHGSLRAEAVPFAIGLLGRRTGGVMSDPEFVQIRFVALMVLVVACANVGMLIFARTVARAGELSIRTALGASRTRVVMQLFAEGLVLAVLAAGLGLLVGDVVASQFHRAVSRLGEFEQELPYWSDLGIKRETVARAMVLAVLSAVLAGVLPALRVTGRAIQRNMQRAAAGRTGVRFGGFSSALVVADVAFAVAASGVAIVFLTALPERPADPPVAASEFMSARVALPETGLDPDRAVADPAAREARIASAQESLLRLLASEPGVRGVAMGDVLPGIDYSIRPLEGMADDAADGRTWHRIAVARVGRGYFEALGQPIVQGRGFDAGDLGDDRTAVVVDETFVDRVLAGRNALGRTLRYREGTWYTWPEQRDYVIVGVVPDIGSSLTNPTTEGAIYHAVAPGELDPIRIAVRRGDDPLAFAPRLRTLVDQADAELLLSDIVALDDVVSWTRIVYGMSGAASIALIAVLLVLSVSGIYALMSFTVSERTREIGIRTALGADRTRIAFAMAWRSLVQLAIGIVLGVPIAAWFLGSASDFGSGSPSLALAPLMGVAMIVVIVLGACLRPTLRALRIAPTEALREGG